MNNMSVLKEICNNKKLEKFSSSKSKNIEKKHNIHNLKLIN